MTRCTDGRGRSVCTMNERHLTKHQPKKRQSFRSHAFRDIIIIKARTGSRSLREQTHSSTNASQFRGLSSVSGSAAQGTVSPQRAGFPRDKKRHHAMAQTPLSPLSCPRIHIRFVLLTYTQQYAPDLCLPQVLETLALPPRGLLVRLPMHLSAGLETLLAGFCQGRPAVDIDVQFGLDTSAEV